MVEHRTGIAEVTGLNTVEALIFFRLFLSNCLNWKIHCSDDHSSSINMNYFIYASHYIEESCDGLASTGLCLCYINTNTINTGIDLTINPKLQPVLIFNSEPLSVISYLQEDPLCGLQELTASSTQDADSLMTLVEGYYRLMVNQYKQLNVRGRCID